MSSIMSPPGVSLANASDNLPDQSLSQGTATTIMEDAKLKAIWDEEMKDFEPAGKPHRTTVVLMISWVEDDLNTSNEVCGLERTFQDIFNYEVIKRQISGGPRDMLPGVQVTKYLLELVEHYDSDSTLLIVYYAGHGFCRKSGGLQLAGKRTPNGPEPTVRNAAAWTESEHIIRDTKGDVLLIFDCCYAGMLLEQNVRSWPCYPTRKFECLAACGPQQTTRFPGDDSFTSALIWALTVLGTTKKRFTTLELQTKIMREAPHFPDRQFVPLLERGEPCDQRLVLAPQLAGSETSSPTLTSTSTSTAVHVDEPLLRNYMDLRFWFPSRPNEEQVANLAQRLKKLMLDESIGARRIRWEGLKNVDLERREVNIARLAVNRWKSFLSSANGNTTTTLDPDLLSTGSRTRPSSLFSLPEIADARYRQRLTPTEETFSTTHSGAQKLGIAPLLNSFERLTSYGNLRSTKMQSALAILGVLSIVVGMSYFFRLRPLSSIWNWACWG